MSDTGRDMQEQGPKLLHQSYNDRMSPLVRLSKVQRFLDWLEFEVQTKKVEDRPSASQILREFKRLSGILSYTDTHGREPSRGHDQGPTDRD